MKSLKLLNNYSELREMMELSIKQKAVDGSPLEILEAGCGQRWYLNLNEIEYKLTGVDLDKDALEIREKKFQDLDQAILGDLTTINLEENKYDVIFNSFVLEHIENAEQVLNNFFKWLKPGGLLILSIPDRNSVFGFVTRVSPFSVHVFYHKYILGNKNAGKAGFNPYPTFHEKIISREGIHKYCEKNGYLIQGEYGSASYARGKGVIPILIYLFVILLHLLSFGKLDWKYNNLTYILEKQ